MRAMARSTLSEWFATPLGAYVLAREQAFCDEVVADIFGFNALQLGHPQLDFLRASRMPLRFAVANEPVALMPSKKDQQVTAIRPADTVAPQAQTCTERGPALVRGRGAELPVATQSMDLVLLPHVLEFARDPHQILREVDRVMMPEGRLIIIGFNPWSLWGLRQAFGRRGDEHPWCGEFISMVRLKDWLALLGFDVSAGRLSCYVPPLANERWLNRFSFMEAAGDRWWGIAGGVYMMQAIKRVQGMRLITPKWKERRLADKVVVPLSRRSGNQREVRPEAPANVIALPRKK
jgi:SAM-dependent methyltransferase